MRRIIVYTGLVILLCNQVDASMSPHSIWGCFLFLSCVFPFLSMPFLALLLLCMPLPVIIYIALLLLLSLFLAFVLSIFLFLCFAWIFVFVLFVPVFFFHLFVIFIPQFRFTFLNIMPLMFTVLTIWGKILIFHRLQESNGIIFNI